MDGNLSLLDLFEGRRQLIVGHFMFDPSWDAGCSSCSDGSVAPVEYNYRISVEDEQPLEAPGRSCFLREGDSVFHTYSVYARGLETVGGSYHFLDETALGRQEAWEEPKGRTADARGAGADFSS